MSRSDLSNNQLHENNDSTIDPNENPFAGIFKVNRNHRIQIVLAILGLIVSIVLIILQIILGVDFIALITN